MIRRMFPFLLVALLATGAGARGETRTVVVGDHPVGVRTSEQFGDVSMVRAECIIPAPRDRVWRVLTDYNHIDDIVPAVTESRLERADDGRMLLHQSGRSGVWIFTREFHVTLEVTEVPKSHIGFRIVEGDFKRFDGSWQIADSNGGTWAAHRVEVQPDFFAPGWAQRHVARRLMAETIEGVIARCVQEESPAPVADAVVAAAGSTYTHGAPSPGGTGKFYMGREISQVMGHRGADWLERPSRERDEAPDSLVERLGLAPGDVVADIGAGSGYFTFRIAPLVPEGAVFAVDIQPEMLDIIRERMRERGEDNVVPLLGAVDDTRLPADSVDVALLVDAYHEFSHPREMMESIVRALRPGGRVVLVEYRGEDPSIPIKPLHKMTQDQARTELSAAGLVWVDTLEFLPRQHVMIFEKPRRGNER